MASVLLIGMSHNVRISTIVSAWHSEPSVSDLTHQPSVAAADTNPASATLIIASFSFLSLQYHFCCQQRTINNMHARFVCCQYIYSSLHSTMRKKEIGKAFKKTRLLTATLPGFSNQPSWVFPAGQCLRGEYFGPSF